jgi:RNA polymerase sigma-70 factor (ECF subfamily)
MYAPHLLSLDDLELIKDYQQTNNIECVGILYQRYAHLIFGVCMKYLKNEADAQDTSIQIFEKLLVILKKAEVNQFKPWLHFVCKNHCLMQIRSSKAKYKDVIDSNKSVDVIMENDTCLHLTEENNKEWKLIHMEECLKGLNDEQRLCVELFFLKEKSYQEVTELTNYSMNNVKSYIQNGKRNLKNCVEKRMKE